MRYDDASGSFSAVSGNPDARDDADVLPAGSHGPATGNTITGAGTITGLAGADVVPDGTGKIVALEGATGSATSDGGNMHVGGRFGDLTMDTHGNYKYTPNVATPNGARDVFRYTLADNAGARDAATLTIEIGKDPQKIDANAQQIIPGPDGVVTLPPGVELSDVHVVGRNLVIDMPDGTQMIIIDGAVFVPQLVLNGVEVPATNLAALLIDAEPQPAAGIPQSSGGNFDVPVPPLDPGVPLGDLIPPTELVYTPPEFHDVGQLVNRTPDAGTVSVQLDDDALQGGNPGGIGDDADSVNPTGFLPGSGGDGALTFDLLSGGAPAGFSYVDGPNGSILVQQVQGAITVTVLTVTVNPATGAYSVTQNAPILHASGGDENNAAFTINYTVTDSDGDSAPGTININVDDDTPTVAVIAGSDAEVSLTTHDAATIGANSESVSTSANFGGVFSGTTVSYGADGPGVGSSSGYSLTTTGVSGLTQGGVAIVLYSVGGTIVGSTSATAGGITAANTVFTVSVNATGVVTLTQFSQIDHTNTDPSPTGAPFTDQSISMADGSITLTRSETAVDRDGDSVTGTASVGIGANLHFVDDGPSIGQADRGEPTLTVDETNLGTNATASFAANFSASFGADGPAANSITYGLGISAPGANSGLVDVATGSAIVLVQNGAVVEGHVGTAAGALAFTVSVNAAGDVTLDQIRAVQHPDGTNPNDSVTLSADNLVTLTATAHDFDGDTASSTLNIGTNLNFLDDGPSISPSETQPSLTVDETNLAANATASFASVFTSAFGADGAGTITYGLNISAPGANSGLIDVATGSAIVLVLNGGVVEGHVATAGGALAFTVSINAAGDVTLDQIRAVQHPDASNPNDSVTLGADNLISVVATITDKDGDSATATANIGQNLNFLDDGPSISAGGEEPSLTVDETVLATNATTNFAGVFTSSFGADGAGTVTYALGISAPGANSGLVDTATGQNIVLVQNGTVVEGHVGTVAGALAFTVSVNAAGDVTLDQIRAVVHTTSSNPDTSESATLSADNLVTLTATVTDKDGDHTSATANIGQNLVFQDDGPSANNDSDDVASGGTTASGNVITGVGTNEGAANADNPGADGFGSISGLVSNGTSNSDTNPAGGYVVVGTYGTLSMDANGNYTYTRASGGAGNVSETFTYTYQDGDGDTATATLTINISDAAPTAGSVTVGLDDDALAGGNAGGIGDDPNSVNATGTLPGSGGDGALTFGVALTGAPVGFTYISGGAGIVLVQQGGVTVLTVTVNSTTGAYSVVQNAPILHAAGGDENNQAFTINYTVSDVDLDTANGTINISVDDDTPTVSASGTQPNLTVDETNLATNATASFSGVFTDSFGADGPALSNSVIYTLGISAPGANSGLIDVATGSAIVLVLNGNVVEGHVATAGGALAFTVSVNAAGDVTLDQIRALSHPDANNPNDSVTPSADNLVTLTQTITDKDGDSASATANIGQNLVFQDDGPSISASSTQPNLTVDETNLATNATASFAGVFTSAFGADGAGAVTYALDISAPSANSGLIDVATGSAIVLVNNAGVIEGHVGTAAGALAFTVTVDASGNVTLDQIRALSHPDANNPNDSVTLSADTLVTLTATVTDKDGDHQAATANIGTNLIFLDDGPSISASSTQPNLTVDETNLATNATAAFAGVFTSSFGVDGAGTVTYALGISAPSANSGLIDVATGSAIVLVLNGNVVEGHVATAGGALAFTVSVNAAGDVTLDQIRAVSHPDTNNSNDSVTLSADTLVTLTATVTDKDGDHTSATANIGTNLVFLDDGPSISLSGSENTLTVDETNLATNATAAFATAFTSAFGADGAGTVTYALTVTGGNGVASGLIDVATGSAIVLVNNAGVIEGHVASTGGVLAFTVTVDASGNVTLDQIRAVQHPDANNANDSVSLSADNLVVLTATVTDRDGDHVSAALNIGQNLNFLDDGPSISASSTQPNLTVDETNLATNATASFSGVFTSAFGADGAGTVTYALGISAPGANSGLIDVATGSAIVLVLNGNVVEGHVATAGGALAFTVSVNAAGDVTLDQIRAVSHPDTNNSNDSVTLSADTLVTLTATVTDRDGDHQAATANIGTNLIFLDDGPSISLSGSENTLTVDETTLATNATAAFATAFTSAFGADGAGTVTYALTVTGGNGVASGLIDVLSGSAIVLVNNAGVIEGHVATTGGALAFTVTVDASGNVTLDQIRAVSHPDANNPNDSVSLSADNLVVLTATVTDRDGDHVSAALNIGQNLNFLDDGPSISASSTQPVLTVDETVLATNATASFAGVFTSAFGADGAGAVTYALGISAPLAASGLVDTLTGQPIVLVLNGNVVEGHLTNAAGALAFTVSVNAAGDVTLDQIRAVVHTTSSNPDTSEAATLSADNLVTLTATVTDKDGDHTSATANIGQNLSFLDDGPTLGVVQSQQTDNNAATTPAVGTLHFAPGADGAGSTMTITANVTGLLSGGHSLVTHQVGSVLTAYQDIGPAGWDAGDTTVVFTITVNPALGTSGQYVFDLVTPLDPTVTETAIGGSSSFGAGPTSQGQVLDNVAGTQHLAVISGYHMGGTFNEATWLSTGSAGPTTNFVTAGVNGSTSGWGIDNNNFNGTDEMFVWDFGSQPLRDPDGAGGYVPAAGVTLPDISTATFDLIGYTTGAGDDISYVVHYTDGTFDSGHIPGTDIDDGTWKFTADAGKFIADIEMFASGLGSGKVDLTSVGVQSTNLNVTIPATVTLTDGDGDTTSAGAFSIHIATGLVPFAPAAPVVLDLNGDGVHFLATDAGVHYDYGHGLVATAWAAPDDGILVRDANLNGSVDGGSEFVFGANGLTDLQSLAAQYGSTLDANDADFAKFAVWQDANSNGVADAGEVQSLTALGITSISLSSDGISYTAANGDVTVAGTGSYTKADGSTGALADAIFQTGSVANADLRTATAANNNSVLLGAIAAAGLGASVAAAAHDAPAGHQLAFAVTAAAGASVNEQGPAAESSDAARTALSGETHEAVDVQPQSGSTTHEAQEAGTNSLTAGDSHASSAPAALLEGTEASNQSAPAQSSFTSGAVAMPSVAMLEAAHANNNAVDTHAQTTGEVGRVLFDALAGGGHGPNIDAVIDAVANQAHAGAQVAIDALASHGAAAVSGWDMASIAGLTGDHAAFTMEHMTFHMDAAPAAA